MKLWRPVGRNELAKIEASGMRAFPSRLPEQPIFYPVLSFEYAEKIARDWNSVRENNDYAGFVVQFDIDDSYASRFAEQLAGGKDCRELWVPAEELEEFNRHIRGRIEVVAEYRNGVRTEDVHADGAKK
ncbi:MAG: hypothetical protein AAFX54_04060 [Pseudomonadota bacterium]